MSDRMPRSFNATPKPFNFKSTQQSPSFIKAVKPPSSNGSGNKFEYSLPHHHHQCTTKCHPRDVIFSLVSSQNLDYAIFSLCARLQSARDLFALSYYSTIFYDRVKCHACAQTTIPAQNQTFLCLTSKYHSLCKEIRI